MFLREEPPAEEENTPPSSSTHPQTLTDQQRTEAAGMQPPQTKGGEAAQPGILDKQHEIAQVLRERLLDKMLDISKSLATVSNDDCEQQLALLRSCCHTYHTVGEELV